MRFKLLVFVFLVLTLMGCKSTSTVTEINTLKEVVENKNFKFVAESANPMPIANVSGLQNLLPPGSNLANINLIGIANFLKIRTNYVELDMPYYGVRRMVSDYNPTNVGLLFKGEANDSQIKFDPKKNRYTVKYDVKNAKESLNLTLIMFPNKTATLSVVSSHRNTINYTGKWEAF